MIFSVKENQTNLFLCQVFCSAHRTSIYSAWCCYCRNSEGLLFRPSGRRQLEQFIDSALLNTSECHPCTYFSGSAFIGWHGARTRY